MLGLLLFQFGMASVLASLKDLPLYAVALTVVTVWVSLIFATLRYRRILARLGNKRMPYGWVFKVNFLSLFISQYAPISAAGDVVRFGYVWKATNFPLREAVESVFYDRILGFATLAVLATLVIPFQWLFIGWGSFLTVEVTFLGTVIVCAVSLWWLARLARGRWLVQLSALLPSLDRLRALLKLKDGAFFLVSSLIIALMLGLGLWLLGNGMGLAVPFFVALVLAPIVALSQNLPFFYSGWGIRELTLIGAFSNGDTVSQQEALALGLALGACRLLAALPGAVFWYSARQAAK